jgi:calcineurin-like phosphoesterase
MLARDGDVTIYVVQFLVSDEAGWRIIPVNYIRENKELHSKMIDGLDKYGVPCFVTGEDAIKTRDYLTNCNRYNNMFRAAQVKINQWSYSG